MNEEEFRKWQMGKISLTITRMQLVACTMGIATLTKNPHNSKYLKTPGPLQALLQKTLGDFMKILAETEPPEGFLEKWALPWEHPDRN